MPLPFLPLMPPDTEGKVEAIISWLQKLIDDFPNAVGNAIDPSLGESGAGALTVDDVPTVSYTSGTTTLSNNTIVAYVDITFALPDRAADLAIFYRKAGVTPFRHVYASSSPYRLTNLNSGTDYEIKVAGRAANNTLGPFSPLYILTADDSGYITTVPLNLEAVGTYQTVVLTWDASTGPVKGYMVERADNSLFTLNLVSWFADVTKFVDDTGLANETYYYRVRAISTIGTYSDYSAVISATTLDIILFPSTLDRDHIHATTSVVMDGALSIVPLWDIAEYIEVVTISEYIGFVSVNTAIYRDGIDYLLSDDRSQIMLSVVPIANTVVSAHYVVMRL